MLELVKKYNHVQGIILRIFLKTLLNCCHMTADFKITDGQYFQLVEDSPYGYHTESWKISMSNRS